MVAKKESCFEDIRLFAIKVRIFNVHNMISAVVALSIYAAASERPTQRDASARSRDVGARGRRCQLRLLRAGHTSAGAVCPAAADTDEEGPGTGEVSLALADSSVKRR